MIQTAQPSLAASYAIQKQTSSWKESVLISAVALAALATFVQLLVGSFTLALAYGLIGGATYIGYQAQQSLSLSITQKEYYDKLYKNTEKLEKERLAFHSENKILLKTNQGLKEQVDTLASRLQDMQSLLAKLDASALLTKDLLKSCIDVSGSQELTERRIHDLLDKLERTTNLTTQKEIEKHVKQLDKTIQSMGDQIKQFFLYDAKAANLLEIKKDLAQTSIDLDHVKSELERVQEELSQTSARLDKTSKTIELKITKLTEQENRLNETKKLTEAVAQLVKQKNIQNALSSREKELALILQENWQAVKYLS